MSKLVKSVMISFSVFVVLWTLLDPLGGLDVILKVDSKLLAYLVLITISIFCGVLIFIIKQRTRVEDFEKDNQIEIGNSRAEIDYGKFIKSTNNELRLLGFSLPSFALHGTLNVFRNLIENNVKIRILMVNPISPSLDQRPINLYKINPNIRNSCLHSLSTFLKFKENGVPLDLSKNFEIGLINVLPSIGMVASDNKVLWSPYLSTHTGTISPFLISYGNSFSKFFLDHFDELWRNHSLQITNKSNIGDVQNFLKEDPNISLVINNDVIKKFENILAEKYNA